jgi:hypothetical protein
LTDVPPDFIQDVSATVPHCFLTCILFGDFLELVKTVRSGSRGSDVGSLEPFVSRQAFKLRGQPNEDQIAFGN